MWAAAGGQEWGVGRGAENNQVVGSRGLCGRGNKYVAVGVMGSVGGGQGEGGLWIVECGREWQVVEWGTVEGRATPPAVIMTFVIVA